MDREDLQSVLTTTGVDLWTLIETAISIAASDHGAELRLRRDGFVERLYALPPRSSENDDQIQIEAFEAEKSRSRAREEEKGSSSPMEKVFGSSPLTPQSNHREEVAVDDEEEDVDVDDDRYGRPIDQELRKIQGIKESLEDPDQSDDSIAVVLQSLADMDITFKALKETDIGRHVNGFRKHPSPEVRRLVKHLVRKWKEIVDEWVKANSENASPAIITDGDSPQQIQVKSNQNGHQLPEFAYSPNPHNGRTSSNRNGLDTVEPKAKVSMPRREAPSRPIQSTPPPSATSAKVKEQMDERVANERLANARKRLQANYQDAQNAKKQRTIQVMGIHEIPKPKNAFVARNKGGHHHQAKHW